MIPTGSEASTLHVLAIGALSRTPLPALRDTAGSLIIARRPVARDLALAATRPESRGAGRPVIIADPQRNLPGAAAEGATVANAVGPSALLAGSGTVIAATRTLLWTAIDAELLHIAGHAHMRGRWRVLPLADGEVGPVDFMQHGLAPRIAVLTGACSAAAMDEEGWGSFAAALLESGTPAVVATDRRMEDNAALSVIREFYAQPDWRADPERALARVQVAWDARADTSGVAWDARADTSTDGASRAYTWAAFEVLRRPPVIVP
jgi:CHAT domain-containing protein